MLRLLTASALLLPTAALAQEEIVVTGRGLPRALGEEAYGGVVIGRERLTGSASGRLDEILREVSGLQLFRRSDARSANPTSQGVTLRALGGNASSRALLILDGVPQTDPFGGWINWPAYYPERLGYVRVVRGGGTGASGPGALAGTIELASADPADLAGVQASVTGGSRDSLDSRASFGAALAGGFLTASAAYSRGDGFVPVIERQLGPVDRRSPYRQGSLSLRAVAPLSRDLELQANALLFSDERERGTAFTANSTTGADASLRLVGRRWEALGYVQTRDYRNDFASVNASRTAVLQASEQYSVPSTGLGGRIEVRPALGEGVEVRVGADWRALRGQTRERFAFVNGAGTRGREAGGRSTTLGGFAEAASEIGPLTITAGARIDHWRLPGGFLRERVLATGATLTDTAFRERAGWEPTARAGLAWRPGGAVTLRGAGYLGWRLPTLNELYRPFRVGADATAANAALAPERLRGAEAGIDHRPLSTARVGVTVFASRLEGAIANVTLGAGPGTFPGVGFVARGGQYRQRGNLDAIEVRGIELDGRLDLGAWSLSGGYSFADAEVRASGPASPLDRLRPAQTPRHLLSGTLSWRGLTGARASITGRYAGAQFEDDLNRQLLPDALTFDLAGGVPLTGRLSLEARADNVTGARVVAGISGDGIVERATPRTFWLGLRLGG
ncbi:MAG TPA: TonB-dependent receptor [Allosphingosinicella sp.]|jgi:outer membrane receptor protein involved in Fe transport|uniref:TonB-dependent receptor n=1 Tax=Allosphingosinicella sp. TaxID=2823234 RepID=UPI002F26E185